MTRLWFPILTKIDPALRKRLITVIKKKYDYFILTGTDPADPGGCCPSDEVASARLLADAGILESREIQSRGGSCPSTLYAFAGEISGEDGDLRFSLHPELRDRVYDHLAGRIYSRFRLLKILMISLLFVFLAVTIGIALYRGFLPVSKKSSDELFLRDFGIPGEECTLLVLFHYQVRCDFCQTVETLSRETLAAEFPGESENKSLIFTHLAMDLPEHAWLKEKFELFTSTLVLISFKQKKAVRWKILKQAWNLTNNPAEFSRMLISEIDNFLYSTDGILP